jgi:hypothetical protein
VERSSPPRVGRVVVLAVGVRAVGVRARRAARESNGPLGVSKFLRAEL